METKDFFHIFSIFENFRIFAISGYFWSNCKNKLPWAYIENNWMLNQFSVSCIYNYWNHSVDSLHQMCCSHLLEHRLAYVIILNTLKRQKKCNSYKCNCNKQSIHSSTEKNNIFRYVSLSTKCQNESVMSSFYISTDLPGCESKVIVSLVINFC